MIGFYTSLRAIRREFHIPPNREITADSLSAGSVFWR